MKLVEAAYFNSKELENHFQNNENTRKLDGKHTEITNKSWKFTGPEKWEPRT